MNTVAEFLLENSQKIITLVALFFGVKCEIKYLSMLEEKETLYVLLTEFSKSKIQNEEEEQDGKDN